VIACTTAGLDLGAGVSRETAVQSAEKQLFSHVVIMAVKPLIVNAGGDAARPQILTAVVKQGIKLGSTG
jgi:DhnA family fructose-bisphosphate aldolase class Ia